MGVAVAAFFYAFIWPNVKASIQKSTCEVQCNEDTECMNRCMNKVELEE